EPDLGVVQLPRLRGGHVVEGICANCNAMAIAELHFGVGAIAAIRLGPREMIRRPVDAHDVQMKRAERIVAAYHGAEENRQSLDAVVGASLDDEACGAALMAAPPAAEPGDEAAPFVVRGDDLFAFHAVEQPLCVHLDGAAHGRAVRATGCASRYDEITVNARAGAEGDVA